jgi:hypothetical protein
MIQLASDKCIFKNTREELYPAIHVDDGLLIGRDLKKVDKLLENIKKEFEITINE